MLCLDTDLIFDLNILCLIFQSTGNLFGDMFEISTIRREDYDFIKDGSGKFVEVLQCNNAASTRTPRGHQGCDSIVLFADSGLYEVLVDFFQLLMNIISCSSHYFLNFLFLVSY